MGWTIWQGLTHTHILSHTHTLIYTHTIPSYTLKHATYSIKMLPLYHTNKTGQFFGGYAQTHTAMVYRVVNHGSLILVSSTCT